MQELEVIAKRIRARVFKAAYLNGSGHLAPSFSMVDLVTSLYFGGILNYKSKDPAWKDRDKFILSKGHASLALYATLCEAGYFDEKEWFSAIRTGKGFGGHPKMDEVPGVEASTGSLGHGLLFSMGIAKANQLSGSKSKVFTIVGDGECQEGSIWEAVMFGAHHRLENLTLIVDHNKLQAMDRLDTILNLEPLANRFSAFGWNTIEVNGHDFSELRKVLQTPSQGKPKAIIAHTTKGKGVSFMEDIALWHMRMPNSDELKTLLGELNLTQAELEAL